MSPDAITANQTQLLEHRSQSKATGVDLLIGPPVDALTVIITDLAAGEVTRAESVQRACPRGVFIMVLSTRLTNHPPQRRGLSE